MLGKMEYRQYPELAPEGVLMDDLPDMSAGLIVNLILRAGAALFGCTALAIMVVSNEQQFGTMLVVACMALHPTFGGLFKLIALSAEHHNLSFYLAVHGQPEDEEKLLAGAKHIYGLRLQHHYQRLVFIGATGYASACLFAAIASIISR